MREIRQSGSVRGVRRNPYPYRDSNYTLEERTYAEARARQPVATASRAFEPEVPAVLG